MIVVVVVVVAVVDHVLISTNASFLTHCVDFLLFVPTAPLLDWVVRIGDSVLVVHYYFH